MTREPSNRPYHPRSYSPEANNLHPAPNKAFSKTTVARQPFKADFPGSNRITDPDDSSSPLDTPAPRGRAPRPTIYDTSDLDLRSAKSRSPKRSRSRSRGKSPKSKSSPKPKSWSPQREKKGLCCFVCNGSNRHHYIMHVILCFAL